MGFKGKGQTRSWDAGTQLADMSPGVASARCGGFHFAFTPVSLVVPDSGASFYAPEQSGASGWI